MRCRALTLVPVLHMVQLGISVPRVGVPCVRSGAGQLIKPRWTVKGSACDSENKTESRYFSRTDRDRKRHDDDEHICDSSLEN